MCSTTLLTVSYCARSFTGRHQPAAAGAARQELELCRAADCSRQPGDGAGPAALRGRRGGPDEPPGRRGGGGWQPMCSTLCQHQRPRQRPLLPGVRQFLHGASSALVHAGTPQGEFTAFHDLVCVNDVAALKLCISELWTHVGHNDSGAQAVRAVLNQRDAVSARGRRCLLGAGLRVSHHCRSHVGRGSLRRCPVPAPPALADGLHRLEPGLPGPRSLCGGGRAAEQRRQPKDPGPHQGGPAQLGDSAWPQPLVQPWPTSSLSASRQCARHQPATDPATNPPLQGLGQDALVYAAVVNDSATLQRLLRWYSQGHAQVSRGARAAQPAGRALRGRPLARRWITQPLSQLRLPAPRAVRLRGAQRQHAVLPVGKRQRVPGGQGGHGAAQGNAAGALPGLQLHVGRAAQWCWG